MRAWSKLPEGQPRAEVIYGKLYLTASPTPYHARISATIGVALANYAQSNGIGEVFFAPVDVILLTGTNIVVPDLVFISRDNQLIVDDKGLHGSPDLHIEILSPSTRKRDLTVKKELYEEAGVKEYWIVDPDTKNSQGYLLKEGKYGDPLLMNSEIYIRILKKIIRF